MEAERVQKILAAAGVASRRKCEELIKEGRVTVNGVVIGIGTSAKATDDIRLDGKHVTIEQKVYIMLHKPKGVTSTNADPHAKTTVLDLVKVPQRVFPVGRLDVDTEGLLLLTNDGELMQRLTHPSKGVDKTYIVTTQRPLADKDIEMLRRGIVIEGRRVIMTHLRQLGPSMVQLSIHEGRKHVVRNAITVIGHKVQRLVRVQLGPLSLGTLQPGKWRVISPAEIALLRKA